MKKLPAHLFTMLTGVLVVSAISALIRAAAEASPVQKPADTSQNAKFKVAMDLATREIKGAPSDAGKWAARALLLSHHGEHAKAAADYGAAIKLNPENADSWQVRGEERFKCGQFAASVSDFDRYLSLEPARKPYHWQRGVSLYYAGRYEEGKVQFELHQTVNPHDVENAVWHFLCTARAEGLSAAKEKLIPIDQDTRIPMAQVHQLFAGKASPEDVLAAARAAPATTGWDEPMFYANLYLGLYYEAVGGSKEARDYILKAAERANENGYMGDVARVHAELLRKKRWK